MMPVKIKLIRSIEYLHSTPEGEIDFEKSKEILVELAKAKRPPADFNVLMDFRRAQMKLSTADIYFLAAELANYEHTFLNKIAILVLPGLDFDKSEFFELCSKNRGLNVDTFSNFEDAMQWFYDSNDRAA